MYKITYKMRGKHGSYTQITYAENLQKKLNDLYDAAIINIKVVRPVKFRAMS